MFKWFAKIDPRIIVLNHVRTFGNAEGKKPWRDWLFFYAIPLFLAGAGTAIRRNLGMEACVANSVTALSLFVPLFFSLLATLFAVFEKSVKQGKQKVERLARALYWNIAYFVLISVLALGMVLLADFFGWTDGRPFKLLFLAGLFHFWLVALMVVKRFGILMEQYMEMKKQETGCGPERQATRS